MIYQAYNVFYILWAEIVGIIITTLGSGVLASEVPGIRYQYLADKVGYGKSITTAIIIVLCR
jgi:hypothetical protein